MANMDLKTATRMDGRGQLDSILHGGLAALTVPNKNKSSTTSEKIYSKRSIGDLIFKDVFN
ncbi:hypothetical protein C0J52_16544 [Blattella germanica]|nr:hypothetical protein C0J52_16544 [Blattella germanica]